MSEYRPHPTDEPAAGSLRWVLLLVLVSVALLVGILLTGCSGISQQEWDDLQAKHKATLSALDRAEEERRIAAAALKRSAERHAKNELLLRRAAEWIREHNGGLLPW